MQCPGKACLLSLCLYYDLNDCCYLPKESTQAQQIWCHDSQHNDIQHNDTQHKGLIFTPSICNTQRNKTLCWMSLCWVWNFTYCCAEGCFDKCHYTKCHYAECRGAAQTALANDNHIENRIKKSQVSMRHSSLKSMSAEFFFFGSSSMLVSVVVVMVVSLLFRLRVGRHNHLRLVPHLLRRPQPWPISWGRYHKTFYARNLLIFVVR